MVAYKMMQCHQPLTHYVDIIGITIMRYMLVQLAHHFLSSLSGDNTMARKCMEVDAIKLVTHGLD